MRPQYDKVTKKHLVSEGERLLSLGYKLVPVEGKRALLKGWRSAALSDIEELRAWVERGATGWGLVVPPGLVVLDFDPRNGGDWTDYDLPETVVCHTGGGGRHYYYRLPEGMKVRSKSIASGIDVKAEGGYVIVPPSRTEKGEYVWQVGAELGEIEIAPAPAWLLAELGGAEWCAGKLYVTDVPVRQGMRHNYVVSLAGALALAGVEVAEIESAILGLWEQGLIERDGFDIKRELEGLRAHLHRWQTRGDATMLKNILDRLPLSVRSILQKHIKEKEIVYERGGKRGHRARREEIAAVIAAATWVEYRREAYVLEGRVLIPAEQARLYVTARVQGAGRETIEDEVERYLMLNSIPRLSGLVLGNYLQEAKVGDIVGLWGHFGGELYCYTVDGIRVWKKGEWPEGVYVMYKSRGLERVEGTIEDFLWYITVAGVRLDADVRVIMSMLIPPLIGGGDAAFIFAGPAGAGKSMFAKALAYLEAGEEWITRVGSNARDVAAAMVADRISFFDDQNVLTDEIQSMLRSKITHSAIGMRALFKNFEMVNRSLEGSAIICTTSIDSLSHDLADRSFYVNFSEKGGSGVVIQLKEEELLKFYKEMSGRARGGMIEIWRRAQKVVTERNLLPEVRFRRWVDLAYRIAVVLGVGNEFMKYVRNSRLQTMRSLRYGFLVDFFTDCAVEIGKGYRLKDIWGALGKDLEDTEYVKLVSGLKRGTKNMREIETIAKAAGYSVKFEREVIDKQSGKKELVMYFSKKEEASEGGIEKLASIFHKFVVDIENPF